jgi:hypothetical protein
LKNNCRHTPVKVSDYSQYGSIDVPNSILGVTQLALKLSFLPAFPTYKLIYCVQRVA